MDGDVFLGKKLGWENLVWGKNGTGEICLGKIWVWENLVWGKNGSGKIWVRENMGLGKFGLGKICLGKKWGGKKWPGKTVPGKSGLTPYMHVKNLLMILSFGNFFVIIFYIYSFFHVYFIFDKNRLWESHESDM